MGCCASTPAESNQLDSQSLLNPKTNPEEKSSTTVIIGSKVGGEGKTFTSFESGVVRMNISNVGNQQTNPEHPKVFAKAPTEIQNAGISNPNQNAQAKEERSEKKAKTSIEGPKSLTGTIIKEEIDAEFTKGPRSLTKMSSDINPKVGQLKVGPEIFVNLKTGSIDESYKTGQMVGEGAYGKVVLVTHRTTGIVRAMKIINKKSVRKSGVDKFFGEVSILRELDHPNIVKLCELFQDDQNYYLVTEYLNGGELFDRIQQMHSFTERQAAEYMKQLLSAIVYLHEKNIVHRDLKPENLLLDSKKHDAATKLIDFGTAQKFESGKKLTQKNGTAYYIAPEVLAKNYDEKCDVWSCGVILYILLCGYPPFNGRNDNEIMANIKKGKFAFDDPDWSRISQEAKNLINKMLTYDPNKRLSAAEALNDDWITKNRTHTPLNKKVLENLSSFQSQNKLKQAIMTFIVTQISSQQEKEELQKIFQELDEDGNGTLSKDELVKGYIKVYGDKEKAEAEALKIIAEVDVNNSGEIDFSEFIMATMNKDKMLSKERMAQAFSMFDQNGDGFITREELAAVMGGIELNDEEWNQIIEEVDANGDGKISKEEFVDLLLKSAEVLNKGS